MKSNASSRNPIDVIILDRVTEAGDPVGSTMITQGRFINISVHMERMVYQG
jgi:hypothetical protein